MPSLENIEKFKVKVQTLAKEPEIRKAVGLPPMEDISPPESGLSEDLTALLEGAPSSSNPNLPPLEDSQDDLGDLLNQQFESTEDQDIQLPPSGDDLDLFSPLPDEPADLGGFDDLNPTANPVASDDFAMDSLGISDFNEPAGNPIPELPSLDENLEEDLPVLDELGTDEDDFTSPADLTAGNFDDFGMNAPLPDLSSQEDEEFSFNDPTLDTEFAGLAGFAARADEVESFDTEGESEQFVLGDFSSQFGVDTADHTDDELNPAQLAEIQTVVAAQTINLTNEEFLILQKNLHKLPLNLKLGIEEAIGEKDLPLDDINRIIQLLLTGGTLKSLATALGKATGKTIKIPLEKSTGEENEKEKASLLYNLRVVMLPILRVSLIITAVVSGLVFLGFQFIIKPLWADDHYKAGWELITRGFPEDGDREFNIARSYGDWEEWYFKYADAFRDQGELDRARNKYKMLLGLPLNYDLNAFVQPDGFKTPPKFNKRALVDWARLESLDGFDGKNMDAPFRKADILFSYLLSADSKDKMALLGRGDNYLRWAQALQKILVPAYIIPGIPLENPLPQVLTGGKSAPEVWEKLEGPDSQEAADERIKEALADYQKSVNSIHPSQHYQGTPEWLVRFEVPPTGTINLFKEANRFYTQYRQLFGLDGEIVSRFVDYFIVQDSYNKRYYPEDEFRYTSGSEREVLNLAEYLVKNPTTNLDSLTLSRLSGYLIEKHLRKEDFTQTSPRNQKNLKEELRVEENPNPLKNAFPTNSNLIAVPYDYISPVRELLIPAVTGYGKNNPDLHYQYARYLEILNNPMERRKALAAAEAFFKNVPLKDLRNHSRGMTVILTMTEIAKEFEAMGRSQEALGYLQNAQKKYESFLDQGIILPGQSAGGPLYEALGEVIYKNSIKNLTREFPEKTAFPKGRQIPVDLSGLKQAEELFLKAQKAYGPPTPRKLLYRVASLKYKKEEYSKAVEILYDLERTRTSIPIKLALANSLFKSEDYFTAEAYYREIQKELTDKYQSIGNLNLQKNEVHLEVLKTIIEVKNNLASAIFRGQGHLLKDSEKWMEVQRLLTEAQVIKLSLQNSLAEKGLFDEDNPEPLPVKRGTMEAESELTSPGTDRLRLNLQILNNSRGIQGKQTLEIYPDIPQYMEIEGL